jgi:hypothetical protein
MNAIENKLMFVVIVALLAFVGVLIVGPLVMNAVHSLQTVSGALANAASAAH